MMGLGPPCTICTFRMRAGIGTECDMRRDVGFDAEGMKLAGWLYVPDDAAGPAPCIVMAHGFSAAEAETAGFAEHLLR